MDLIKKAFEMAGKESSPFEYMAAATVYTLRESLRSGADPIHNEDIDKVMIDILIEAIDMIRDSEPLVFIGLRSTCRRCGNTVLVNQDQIPPFTLNPNSCPCLGCGKLYKADLQGLSPENWSRLQREEKADINY